jgi:uncharacterized protein (DUF488 family)
VWFRIRQTIFYKILENLNPGIDYIHSPQLGIESNKRQDLDSQESYKKLFDEYETTLPDREEALNQVLALQKKYQRITNFAPCPIIQQPLKSLNLKLHNTQTIHL